VLGLLPLVIFGDGAGSNIWDALALVLIGGLLSSTLFVLTITPAVYRLLEGLRGDRAQAVSDAGNRASAPLVGGGTPRPAGAWAKST
jgi:hypothetical protein